MFKLLVSYISRMDAVLMRACTSSQDSESRRQRHGVVTSRIFKRQRYHFYRRIERTNAQLVQSQTRRTNRVRRVVETRRVVERNRLVELLVGFRRNLRRSWTRDENLAGKNATEIRRFTLFFARRVVCVALSDDAPVLVASHLMGQLEVLVVSRVASERLRDDAERGENRPVRRRGVHERLTQHDVRSIEPRDVAIRIH